MKTWRQALRDGFISGGLASVLSTMILGWRGKRDAGTPYAPTNAISHWLWVDRAFHRDRASAKYTLTGYAIHHSTSVFWAVIYEKLLGSRSGEKSVSRTLADSAAMAGVACFVDYALTPKRLQPGFEQRLSKKSLFLVYASFGLGLAMHELARKSVAVT